MLNMAQEIFCAEYVKNFGNASAAYHAAFPTIKHPGPPACALLKKKEIQERVKELQKEAFEAAALTPEKIGLKLNELAFGENVQPSAQLKALELLQKQFGLQQQSIKAQVVNDIVITID